MGPITKAIMERRIAVFRVPDRVKQLHADQFQQLLAQVYIVSAVYRYDYGGVEYMGYSPLFDKVAGGEEAKRVLVVERPQAFGPAMFEFEGAS